MAVIVTRSGKGSRLVHAEVDANFVNLNAGPVGSAEALKSATTTINVVAAAAPSDTQVLTATSATTATWQTPVALRSGNTVTVGTSGALAALVHGILTLDMSLFEQAVIAASAPSATTNFSVQSQSVLYHTTDATANWTLNIRGSSGATLNSIMATGQVVSIIFMAAQGATPYYQSSLTIDGAAVTPKWQGGSAVVSGNASGIDIYSMSILKTAANTYTALVGLTKFS